MSFVLQDMQQVTQEHTGGVIRSNTWNGNFNAIENVINTNNEIIENKINNLSSDDIEIPADDGEDSLTITDAFGRLSDDISLLSDSFTTHASSSNALINNSIKSVNYNSVNGRLTFTKNDNSTFYVDLPTEFTPINFSVVYVAENFSDDDEEEDFYSIPHLKIELADGTTEYVSLSDLLSTPVIVGDEDTITVTYDKTLESYPLATLSLANGGVSYEHLDSEIQAKIDAFDEGIDYIDSIIDSAFDEVDTKIDELETLGSTFASQQAQITASAASAAEDADLAKSYAVGGSTGRPNDDADNAKWYSTLANAIANGTGTNSVSALSQYRNNNAKYWSEQSQRYAGDASTYATNANTYAANASSVYDDVVEKYDDVVEMADDISEINDTFTTSYSTFSTRYSDFTTKWNSFDTRYDGFVDLIETAEDMAEANIETMYLILDDVESAKSNITSLHNRVQHSATTATNAAEDAEDARDEVLDALNSIENLPETIELNNRLSTAEGEIDAIQTQLEDGVGSASFVYDDEIYETFTDEERFHILCPLLQKNLVHTINNTVTGRFDPYRYLRNPADPNSNTDNSYYEPFSGHINNIRYYPWFETASSNSNAMYSSTSADTQFAYICPIKIFDLLAYFRSGNVKIECYSMIDEHDIYKITISYYGMFEGSFPELSVPDEPLEYFIYTSGNGIFTINRIEYYETPIGDTIVNGIPIYIFFSVGDNTVFMPARTYGLGGHTYSDIFTDIYMDVNEPATCYRVKQTAEAFELSGRKYITCEESMAYNYFVDYWYQSIRDSFGYDFTIKYTTDGYGGYTFLENYQVAPSLPDDYEEGNFANYDNLLISNFTVKPQLKGIAPYKNFYIEPNVDVIEFPVIVYFYNYDSDNYTETANAFIPYLAKARLCYDVSGRPTYYVFCENEYGGKTAFHLDAEGVTGYNSCLIYHYGDKSPFENYSHQSITEPFSFVGSMPTYHYPSNSSQLVYNEKYEATIVEIPWYCNSFCYVTTDENDEEVEETYEVEWDKIIKPFISTTEPPRYSAKDRAITEIHWTDSCDYPMFREVTEDIYARMDPRQGVKIKFTTEDDEEYTLYTAGTLFEGDYDGNEN